MTQAAYRLTGPIGQTTLGLIVLQVDETVEHDFRRLFPAPGVALHVSRVASGADLTPETIAGMEAHLTQAAALLPPAARFDALGYACTSAATLLGAERVAGLLRAGAQAGAVTDPLSAALAAMAALSVRRIALVSPYIAEVGGPVRDAFQAAGVAVPAMLSFGERVEARVARIDPASTRAAALEIGRRPGVEAVFLSCTNLRTLDIIAGLEAELGLPVVSSNLALAWHMARLSGAPLSGAVPARLCAV